MKPSNRNQPIDIGDGAPLCCNFLFKDDAPKFWSRCEQASTQYLSRGEVTKFRLWVEEHPKHTLNLYPGDHAMPMCDTHIDVVRECL